MKKINNIYHILIDRFSGNFTEKLNANHFMGGNIQGITSQLDYIKSLGFDTILLSPFWKSANYHGYHATDFYSVDPHFGTVDDLVDLINNVHHRQMKIIGDFVPNHCSIEHPFFVESLNDVNSPYRKWFFFEGQSSKYKYFMQYKELPKFNLDNEDAAQYMIDVAKYWMKFGLDGYRIDHAIGPSFSFLERLTKQVKSEFPQSFFLGEVWNLGLKRKFYQSVALKNRPLKYIIGTNQDCLQQDYINVLDGVFDFYLFDLILDVVKKNEKCVGNEKLLNRVNKHFSKYPPDFALILFLDNHDMNRFLFYCEQDSARLLDALEFIAGFDRPISIYYGTETLMTNRTSIYDGVEYSDLKVREPFDKTNSSIVSDITKILNQRINN